YSVPRLSAGGYPCVGGGDESGLTGFRATARVAGGRWGADRTVLGIGLHQYGRSGERRLAGALGDQFSAQLAQRLAAGALPNVLALDVVPGMTVGAYVMHARQHGMPWGHPHGCILLSATLQKERETQPGRRRSRRVR